LKKWQRCTETVSFESHILRRKMNYYLKQVKKLESTNRIALTSKYPFLLPFVLEAKRMIYSISYNFNPKFKTQKNDSSTWFHLVEHSSPLYRKYNKKELDEGKIENIKIAISNINEIVIPPGKVFSFWKHVGRSSKKRGFKKGLVLSGGQLKEDVGGGLCQLSNLIAYMFACSECVFTERKHHSRDVFPDHNRSVPFASGATVFFNLIDLKVKNIYPFPIKINLRTTDTQLRGSLSASVSLDYFVKLEEIESYFIKSTKTNNLYRCNKLNRVFYEKITKTKLKEIPLWLNTAQVMYDESSLSQPILLVDLFT
jgi:vancomycin resistance protein VanW